MPQTYTKILLLVTATLLMLSSCTQQKQLVYMRTVAADSTEMFNTPQPDNYRIQKQDVLYIRIYTMDENVRAMLNPEEGSTSNQYNSEASLYVQGYVVNDSGQVTLPMVGEVPVVGKTVEEATRAVKEKTKAYLKDATVILKLLSFKFTVIGEVNRPGVYRNFNNQLTVLEAIGMAGDISDFGNRREVVVLRPSKSGTITYRLNLTDKNILESPAFFLLPNDMVYVEPIKSKIFQLNTGTITLALSTISTLILILNFIQ